MRDSKRRLEASNVHVRAHAHAHLRIQLPSHDYYVRVPVKREKRLQNFCVSHPFWTFLLSLTPAEAQEAPTALEAMETRNLPAVPAMETREVPAVPGAVQVARKKEMQTPRRLSGKKKNTGHLCTMTEGRPLESEAQKTAECRRCIESNGIWKDEHGAHGH